jgi:hypothetical protein
MIAGLIANGYFLDVERCVPPVLLFARERTR